MFFKSTFFYIFLIPIRAYLPKFPLPTYDTALSKALIDYTSHMMKISPVVNFMQVSDKNNTMNQLYIMNEVLYHASRKGGIFRVILKVDDLPKFRIMLKNRKRFNTIVFVDSFESFYKFVVHINLEDWRYSGNIVVALTIHNEDIYHCMMKIFEAFWSKRIVNVIIMFTPHANINEVLLYTYYPFSAFYCERAIPIQLNHFSGNKYLNPIEYFPKKLDNLHGCPISVVTFKNPPFMFVELDKYGAVHVDGIDGIVLRVLSQQLNFNVTIYNDPEAWGRTFDNGSVTGAMKWIYEDKINMTIGFFASLPRREQILKSSYVYFTTNLIWMVPPGKSQSPLQKLLNPLEDVIWILVAITNVIGISVIAIIKMTHKDIQNFVFGRKTVSPGMNLINIVLGNSLHQLPFRNFSRFLFLMFTFHCFILRSSYQGGLVKFMQMDTREPKMMNTKQLLENNFSLYYLDSANAYFDEIPGVKSHSNTITLDDYSRNLVKLKNPHFNGAFLTSESHLAYRNKLAFPNYYNYAPESVFTINLVIYMQRDFCLRTVIDLLLVNLVCSGLINKWASSWIDDKYMKEPTQQGLQILSLQQLEGAFNLLGFGLTAATLAFFVEIIFYKAVKVYEAVKKIVLTKFI